MWNKLVSAKDELYEFYTYSKNLFFTVMVVTVLILGLVLTVDFISLVARLL